MRTTIAIGVIALLLTPVTTMAANCGCDLSGSRSANILVPYKPWNGRTIWIDPRRQPVERFNPRGEIGRLPWFKPAVSIETRLNGCSNLRDAIFWQTATGQQVPFAKWSSAQKQRLDHFFQALLRGSANLGIQCPDPAQALHNRRTFLAVDEAFDVYAAHVAHVLYLEATNKVPWSIGCRPLGELVYLLASDRYQTPISASTGNNYPAHIQAGRDFHTPFYTNNAPALSCDPREGYRFMTGNQPQQSDNLIGTNEEDTLANLSLFFRDHWNHDESFGTSNNFQWDQEILLSDRLTPSGQNARQAFSGCHSAAGTFFELARSVNIPLINVGTQESRHTDGHYGNRSHRGLIYNAASAQPRILWHIDDIYAVKPGPIFPINAQGAALSDADAKRVYFESYWPTSNQIRAWGFEYNPHRVFPGNAFGANDRGIYEDYPTFGVIGGNWLISDRAEQLYAKPPADQAEWDQYKQMVGDLQRQWALENYYHLGSHDLVKHACDPSWGQTYLNNMVDQHQTGNRTGLTPPVTRTKADYWQRAQDAVQAHGGCSAIDSAYNQWQQGRN